MKLAPRAVTLRALFFDPSGQVLSSPCVRVFARRSRGSVLQSVSTFEHLLCGLCKQSARREGLRAVVRGTEHAHRQLSPVSRWPGEEAQALSRRKRPDPLVGAMVTGPHRAWKGQQGAQAWESVFQS